MRALTALLGGYAVTAATAALAARLLPLPRPEATAWATIGSFLLYALIALWCFREPRLAVVAGMVWGGAAVGVAAALLLGTRP